MKSLAFIGCSHIHTPGFVRTVVSRKEEFRVAAAWDPNPVRAQKVADATGCAVAQELDSILADPDIPAVVICSETNRHLELIQAAVAAGKDISAEN